MRGQKVALVLRLVGIGWFVAMCIGGGAVVGLLLDRQLETGPILTLVGLCVGIAAAVTGMYRMLMAVLASPEEQ
jgi:F0F1-type ATP synthase assembly protein I